MSFNPNLVKTLVDEAPEAGFANQQFGRLTVLPQIIHWEGAKGSKKTKVARPVTEDTQDLARGESFELVFTVHISELNPSLEFEYERGVIVRKSSDRELTDWTEIVEPSLIAVFGNDWASEVAKEPYVQVEGTPNVAGKRADSGKAYDVPKFIARYADLAECLAAREERYGGGATTAATDNSSATMQLTPPGVPVGVANSYKALRQAMGGNTDSLPEIVASDPTYSAYTLEQLEASIEFATA